jgi:hypothetical protein
MASAVYSERLMVSVGLKPLIEGLVELPTMKRLGTSQPG